MFEQEQTREPSPIEDPKLGLRYLCANGFDRIAHLVNQFDQAEEQGREEECASIITEIRGLVTETCKSCEQEFLSFFRKPSLKCLGKDVFKDMAEVEIDFRRFMRELPFAHSFLIKNIHETRRMGLQINSFVMHLSLMISQGLRAEGLPPFFCENELRELLKNAMVHGNQSNGLLNLERSVFVKWEIEKSDDGTVTLFLYFGDHGRADDVDYELLHDSKRRYELQAGLELAGERLGIKDIKEKPSNVFRGAVPVLDPETGEDAGKLMVLSREFSGS